MLLIFLLAGSCLLTVGCGGTFEPVDHAEAPSPDDYPEAGKVYLQRETVVTYQPGPEGRPVAVQETRQSWYILRDTNDYEEAGLSLHYSNLREILDAEVRITPPHGESRTMGLADAQDFMSFPAFVMYSDSRRKRWKTGSLAPGTRVDFTYTLRYSDIRLFGQGYLFFGPTENARFEVRAPEGWKIRWLARQLNQEVEEAPEASLKDGQQVWVWEREDLGGVEQEFYSPPMHAQILQVDVQLDEWTEGGERVTAWRTPRALSAGEYELVSQAWADEESARQVLTGYLDEALADAPPGADDETIAAHLHAWVRENIAYCAVSVGWGGWIPHSVDQIADNKYGDCKDKATILRSMLALKGIDSDLATVFAHGGYPVGYGLDTIAGNFNHAILRINLQDGPVYVDPTARTVPLGELPSSLLGAEVLPITEEGSDLVTLARGNASQNQNRLTLDVTLEGEEMRGRFALEQSGTWAHRGRNQVHNHTSAALPRKMEWMLRLQNQVEIESLQVGNSDTSVFPSPLKMSGRLTAKLDVTRAGSRIILKPADILDFPYPVLTTSTRKNPIVLGSPDTEHISLKMKLPPGLVPRTLPPESTIESEYGTYAQRWAYTGDHLLLERRATVKVPWIPAEDAESARAFFEQVQKAEAVSLVLAPESQNQRPDEQPESAPPAAVQPPTVQPPAVQPPAKTQTQEELFDDDEK